MSSPDDSKRTPMAPSSEPFYSNIPAAPISSSTPYPSAPPVSTGGFGDADSLDPYSDMGYAAAQAEQVQAEPAPPPAALPPTPAPQYSPTPVHPSPVQYSSGQGHPSVEDLYRAPGNPYADRSGRAAPSPGHTHVSTPGFIPATAKPAGSKRSRRSGRGWLALIVLFIVFGNVGIRAVSSFVDYLEETFTSDDLPTISDTDLEVGDCFLELNYVSGNQLQPVPCEDPHRFQVVLNTLAPFDEHPGEDDLASAAQEICQEIAGEIADELDTTRLTRFSLYPSESGWSAGDQTITCFVSTAGSTRLHGSYTDGTLEIY